MINEANSQMTIKSAVLVTSFTIFWRESALRNASSGLKPSVAVWQLPQVLRVEKLLEEADGSDISSRRANFHFLQVWLSAARPKKKKKRGWQWHERFTEVALELPLTRTRWHKRGNGEKKKKGEKK